MKKQERRRIHLDEDDYYSQSIRHFLSIRKRNEERFKRITDEQFKSRLKQFNERLDPDNSSPYISTNKKCSYHNAQNCKIYSGSLRNLDPKCPTCAKILLNPSNRLIANSKVQKTVSKVERSERPLRLCKYHNNVQNGNKYTLDISCPLCLKHLQSLPPIKFPTAQDSNTPLPNEEEKLEIKPEETKAKSNIQIKPTSSEANNNSLEVKDSIQTLYVRPNKMQEDEDGNEEAEIDSPLKRYTELRRCRAIEKEHRNMMLINAYMEPQINKLTDKIDRLTKDVMKKFSEERVQRVIDYK